MMDRGMDGQGWEELERAGWGIRWCLMLKDFENSSSSETHLAAPAVVENTFFLKNPILDKIWEQGWELEPSEGILRTLG